MEKKDQYKHQKRYITENYASKALKLRKEDYYILNKNLKEKNINFRQLILNFLKEEGLLDE